MRRIYPWEQWFSKDRTVILRGVHYRCSQSTMVQTIRNNATQRGIKVSVDDTNTEIIIEVKHGDKTKEGRQAVSDVRGDVPSTRTTDAGARAEVPPGTQVAV